jgi:glycosyltransferase involved in cell wall biosynthesis
MPARIAGTEVYVWTLSKMLVNRSIEVNIVIPNYNNTTSEVYNVDGLEVYKYAEPSVIDRQLRMGFRRPDGLPNFIKYLEDKQPDIVHFHEIAGSNGISIHHVVAAKSMGCKVLMTFHLANYSCKAATLMYKDKELCDGLIDVARCSECMITISSSPAVAKPVSMFANLLYAFGIDPTRYHSKIATALGYPFIIERLRKQLFTLADTADKLVVLTHWYKRILTDNQIDENKVMLIKQGLPIPVKPTPDRVKSPNEVCRFIFVGRISSFKGVSQILDAIEKVNSSKFQVDFYGSDPHDDYATKCKQRMQEITNVRWMGKLEPGEVVNTMKQYDVLILASTFSEMSPLVIQEAFAAKIPVLASNVYGNLEQVQDGINGWLFKFKDSDSLAEMLKYLIEKPAIIDQAKNNICSTRMFDDVVNDYLKVYNELMKNTNQQTALVGEASRNG